ncbi:MAG: radical SAM protein [Chloroflexi bacterium]|nr:radical SAM protein [Chloroflexota bacterium]
MSLNIVLLTPRRRFIANRWGLGYQIPLGMVFLGGPLLDAGHKVQLVDNDVYGWSDAELVSRLKLEPPDVLMVGHTGSTAAHPAAMETCQTLKAQFPEMLIVYGGVYPSYAAQDILVEHPYIDIVVQGEGERTALELCAQLDSDHPDLCEVKGITWRDGGHARTNPAQPPITDMDSYRPGWELVDWQHYELFGFGRAAGMQFSRGCTLKCTYCGQWAFWRRWRHRSAKNFADEVEKLVKEYGVKIVWLADENFAAQPEQAHLALAELAKRKLGISLNLNMTAADVVAQSEFLPLYKEAGVDNIVMGIEALEDNTVKKVRKNNPYEISKQAVSLLRQHDIVSLVNIIFGLENETPTTLWRTLTKTYKLDADVLNAVYLTPHFWTHDGLRTCKEQIVQPDQSKWTYRNQVINTPQMKPWQLFTGVKLIEALYHLRPKALWRMLLSKEKRFKQVLRAYFLVGLRVFLVEMIEFAFSTQFAHAGEVEQIPSYPKEHSSQAG